MLAGKMLFCK